MYYGVVYCNDRTIHLFPCEDKNKCGAMILEFMHKRDFYKRVVRTTIIKRTGKDDFIFGTPSSLDMKSKFDKLLRKGKVNFDYSDD